MLENSLGTGYGNAHLLVTDTWQCGWRSPGHRRGTLRAFARRLGVARQSARPEVGVV